MNEMTSPPAAQKEPETEPTVLFFRQHMFICTNVRPEGHPRGCCSGKGSVKLRDYTKARAKEFGSEGRPGQ